LKISAQFSVFMAVLFAAACFSVAITGFTSLGEITDPVQLADAKGYAWFWTFLGCIAVVFGAAGVWMLRTTKEGERK
jgi:arginine exporter protein ArgO